MQHPFTITLIKHNSEAYQHMLQLRTTVLLQPIGVDPSFIKPEQETDDVLIGAFEETALIGCCVLTKLSDSVVQLRQMAVARTLQKQGIGTALLHFAETWAKAHHYKSLVLHARSNVVLFYDKNGYVISGEPFDEVGIKHFRMEKTL